MVMKRSLASLLLGGCLGLCIAPLAQAQFAPAGSGTTFTPNNDPSNPASRQPSDAFSIFQRLQQAADGNPNWSLQEQSQNIDREAAQFRQQQLEQMRQRNTGNSFTPTP